MNDLNAKTGNDNRGFEHVIGKKGLGERNCKRKHFPHNDIIRPHRCHLQEQSKIRFTRCLSEESLERKAVQKKFDG